MPSIRIMNIGRIVPTDLVTSVLIALQIHDVRIETVCGGKAQCGKCIIRIIKGKEFLTRKSQKEKEKLSVSKAGEDMRLACQTHTRGDIEIEIVNLKNR